MSKIDEEEEGNFFLKKKKKTNTPITEVFRDFESGNTIVFT